MHIDIYIYTYMYCIFQFIALPTRKIFVWKKKKEGNEKSQLEKSSVPINVWIFQSRKLYSTTFELEVEHVPN